MLSTTLTASPSVHWYLENFSFFDILTTDEKEKLSKAAVKHFIPKGNLIFSSGDVADSFYLVKEGKVKISKRAENGKELIIALLGPGEVFGELSLAGLSEREEVAVTAEDSLVCVFQVSDMEKLMTDSPKLSLQITKLIGVKLKKIQRRLESLIFKTSEERVRDFLKEMAVDYGYSIATSSNEVAIPVKLTHDDIGKLTATSRQTVTTVLNTLERTNVITYDRHRIYIKQMDEL